MSAVVQQNPFAGHIPEYQERAQPDPIREVSQEVYVAWPDQGWSIPEVMLAQPPEEWYVMPAESMFGNREHYGSDGEVFQEVMDDVYARLAESDTIKRFRQPGYTPKSEGEIEAVFRVYDQAIRRALAKQKAKGFVSARQESKIKFAQSETSHGLRHMIIDHFMNMAEHGTASYVMQDFTTILNGELRKHAKESQTNLRLVKGSGSTISQETMQREMTKELDQASDEDLPLAA